MEPRDFGVMAPFAIRTFPWRTQKCLMSSRFDDCFDTNIEDTTIMFSGLYAQDSNLPIYVLYIKHKSLLIVEINMKTSSARRFFRRRKNGASVISPVLSNVIQYSLGEILKTWSRAKYSYLPRADTRICPGQILVFALQGRYSYLPWYFPAKHCYCIGQKNGIGANNTISI